MDGSHYGNAMTEIALALSMAFFSVMTLTMISMGAGDGTAEAKARPEAVIAAVLAPAAPDSAPAARLDSRAGDTLVVYRQGRFYDRDLRPLDPAERRFSGRVILAVDPTVRMTEALAARARIGADDLVVSTLDGRWLEALARRFTKED